MKSLLLQVIYSTFSILFIGLQEAVTALRCHSCVSLPDDPGCIDMLDLGLLEKSGSRSVDENPEACVIGTATLIIGHSDYQKRLTVLVRLGITLHGLNFLDGQCHDLPNYVTIRQHVKTPLSWTLSETTRVCACKTHDFCNGYYRNETRGEGAVGLSLVSAHCHHCSGETPPPLIVMEGFPEQQFLNTSLQIKCLSSKLAGVQSFRFAIEQKDGDIKELDSEEILAYEDSIPIVSSANISIIDQNMIRVFCLGQTAVAENETTMELIKRNYSIMTSKPINVSGIFLQEPKIFFDKVQPTSDQPSIPKVNGSGPFLEKYSFKKNSLSKSIFCQASGHPAPDLEWIRIDNATVGKTRKLTETYSWTRLTFHKIEEATLGKYSCVATNRAGSTSHDIIVQYDKDSAMDLSWISAPILVVLLCLTCVILYLWRQNRRQQAALRSLTEEEVQEFHKGTGHPGNTLEGDNNNCNIYGRPFNPLYEISDDVLELNKDQVLGSGQFGIVVKGYLRNQGEDMSRVVAVKASKPTVDIENFKALLAEIKIMAFLDQHDNIVQLLGAKTKNIKNREIYAVVEFCCNGDLHKFLRAKRSVFNSVVVKPVDAMNNPGTQQGDHVDGFGVKELIQWALEIANGLAYLAEKRVIHGDLAARNILLNERKVAKISDFGLSRQLVEYAQYQKKKRGPLPFKWMAIESLRDMVFSVQSDLWSFGVVVWEICSLAQVPYPGFTWTNEFVEKLCEGHRMKKPDHASDEMYSIMMDCWKERPEERPSIDSVYARLCRLRTQFDDYDACS